MQSWNRNVPLLAQGKADEVLARVEAMRCQGVEVYPPRGMELRAFEFKAFDEVRVVILGQDPYHGPGQAHGLSFSVPEGQKMPPSLRNIFKEIEASCGVACIEGTDLTPWAEQGVLLLNAVLTVEQGKPGSHAGLGWQELTDDVISALSQDREGLVFMLWGNFARSKAALIDSGKHLVLEAAHPSPFSAHRGFLGCGHFAKSNDYLKAQGMPEIRW